MTEVCVNPQGSSGITVTEGHAGTLVAQDHGNHPAVLHPAAVPPDALAEGSGEQVLQAAGFSTEHSAKARSIGYGEEVSPTLRAGVVPAAMLFDNHPQDCRYDGPLEDSPTVTARYGTGGNTQPLVAEPEPVTLKIRGGCPGGGKGPIRQVNKSATLGTHNDQTLFQPVAFGVCSKSSHSMLSDNPKAGFYEAETSRTLDQGGGNPCCNQGGICIVAPVEPVEPAESTEPAYSLQGSMVGRKEKNGPQGSGINEEVAFTLNTADRHCVAAPVEDASHYSTSKNSFFMHPAKEQANTLVATDYKDPPILNDMPNEEPMYIVRRLTPVECARLQGFPDWWCAGLADPDPSPEEMAFWKDVWDSWNAMNGKKPKTEKQLRKWLADPHTDAAEYKLWGNGLSLPLSYFVLSGIAWAAGKDAV